MSSSEKQSNTNTKFSSEGQSWIKGLVSLAASGQNLSFAASLTPGYISPLKGHLSLLLSQKGHMCPAIKGEALPAFLPALIRTWWWEDLLSHHPHAFPSLSARECLCSHRADWKLFNLYCRSGFQPEQPADLAHCTITSGSNAKGAKQTWLEWEGPAQRQPAVTQDQMHHETNLWTPSKFS